MSDVGKIQGGKSGPSPEGPKRKKGHDPDRFREMMKSGKVRETDPEEQRKRKSKSEREEEEVAEMTTAQPSTQDQFAISSPPPEFYLNVPESSSTEAAAPAAPGVEETSSPYYPEAETEPTVSTPEQPRAERRKAQQQQQVERKETVQKGKKVAKTEKKPAAAKTIKTEAAEPKKPTPTPKAEEKKPSDKLPAPEEGAIPQPPPPMLAQGAWEATEDLERGEEKSLKKVAPAEKGEPSLPTTFQTPPPPPGVILPGEPLQPLAAPFAHLPAPVAALFERMVGVMTVMNTTGVTQTTINLDNPKFAESVFYGAQIVISEYSTAPKAFNIQLLGNQQAVTLFTKNIEDLVAAFQAGNYTFKVNRVETGYLSSAPEERKREERRVKRKKGAE